MGAANYIGRVGGLAGALGVGNPIASGHGIARADATDNTSSGNSVGAADSSTAPAKPKTRTPKLKSGNG